MVHERARVHGDGDGDGVGQVEREDDGESSRWPGSGNANDLNASKLGGGRTRVDIRKVVWRPREDGRFDGLGLKTIDTEASFPVWALKPGVRPMGGRSTRRTCGTIAKLASR
ncbi:unnamed protein product [Urochloa humidicola]